MANKHHVGENAVQRMLRSLRGLNQELIRPVSNGRIELRLDTSASEETGELIYIDQGECRLIGGSIEEIEAFLAADPLSRMLMTRADGARAR